MSRIRLFPVVLLLLFVTFTLRLGDFIGELATGKEARLESATAMANEPVAEKAEEHPKAAGADDKAPSREEIPAKDPNAKEVEVKGLDEEKDPFNDTYSSEEVQLLQSLSKRREVLEKREHDLDQREKLLQAAEKKVDQKVSEMNKLRTEIETLLKKQGTMQDARLAQLVKIYENMKPKDAANIFNEMPTDVLLGIFDTMSERKIAPILAAMDTARAREISAMIAKQRALPKKALDAANADAAN